MSASPATPIKQLVPRVERAWYPLAWSGEVGRKPIRKTLWGQPIALFRGANGQVGALLDRCPHRNVPLSYGAVKGDRLQCGYHGWEFDTTGRCKHIPALVGEADLDSRRCESFAVREQQSMIWVWGKVDDVPDSEPFHFQYADKPGYLTVRRRVEAEGSLQAVAENALDVPHTAFLHGGLFRTDNDRNRISARIKRWDDRVECEYIGEPRPEGLAGRLLSPSGGIVTHFDRFYLPCIVEVEYRIGDENHIVVNAACCPVDEWTTQLFAVVAVKSRIPGWVIKPFVTPVALRIFGQDAVILRLQTETLKRFDRARFVSTDVDTVGPHILRLLKRAERGESPDPDKEPYVKEIELDV